MPREGAAAPHTPPTRVILLLLTLATVAAFWRVCTLDFLNEWDDGENLTRNVDYYPLTAASLAKYWARPQNDVYVPVTSTVWAGLSLIGRTATPDDVGVTLNPYVFHAANLGVHVASAWVLFAILRRLVGSPWAAGLGAALFAVHPLQVEPVAWVTGMKDVLCGFWSFCALLLYLDLAADPGAGRRARVVRGGGAAACFVLAMLSKPSAVALPVVAVALSLTMLRERPRRAGATLLVGLLLAAPIVWINRQAQTGVHPMHFTPTIVQRPVVALDALGFYVLKVLAPVELLIDYGRSPWWVLHHDARWWTWLVPVALAAVAWAARRKAPYVAAACLVFGLSLAPVLGFVPFIFQDVSTVADRYAYVAMAGPALVLAGVLARHPSKAAYAVAGVLWVACTIRSAAQVPHWRNDDALFAYELAHNPSSMAANSGEAALANRRGDPRTALDYQLAAAGALPDNANKYLIKATLQAYRGNAPGAVDALREAIRLDPGNAQARGQLAALEAAIARRAGTPK